MLPFSPQVVGPAWGVSEFVLCLVKRSKSEATSKDRHSLAIIWTVDLIAILVGVLAAHTMGGCRLPWTELVNEIGLGSFVFGLALRWYAIFYLGRFFTVDVAIHPDHRVIDTGPYRFMRHPSYTGGLMMVTGFALSIHNWLSFLIIFIPWLAVTLYRIRIEEAALLEGLGQSYREYSRRTKRLIPFIC